jgi:ABC-type nickel/cobalt efflux system permease component RcnA
MKGTYLIDIDFAFTSGVVICGVALVVLIFKIIKRKFFK